MSPIDTEGLFSTTSVADIARILGLTPDDRAEALFVTDQISNQVISKGCFPLSLRPEDVQLDLSRLRTSQACSCVSANRAFLRSRGWQIETCFLESEAARELLSQLLQALDASLCESSQDPRFSLHLLDDRRLEQSEDLLKVYTEQRQGNRRKMRRVAVPVTRISFVRLLAAVLQVPLPTRHLQAKANEHRCDKCIRPTEGVRYLVDEQAHSGHDRRAVPFRVWHSVARLWVTLFKTLNLPYESPSVLCAPKQLPSCASVEVKHCLNERQLSSLLDEATFLGGGETGLVLQVHASKLSTLFELPAEVSHVAVKFFLKRDEFDHEVLAAKTVSKMQQTHGLALFAPLFGAIVFSQATTGVLNEICSRNKMNLRFNESEVCATLSLCGESNLRVLCDLRSNWRNVDAVHSALDATLYGSAACDLVTRMCLKLLQCAKLGIFHGDIKLANAVTCNGDVLLVDSGFTSVATDLSSVAALRETAHAVYACMSLFLRTLSVLPSLEWQLRGMQLLALAFAVGRFGAQSGTSAEHSSSGDGSFSTTTVHQLGRNSIVAQFRDEGSDDTSEDKALWTPPLLGFPVNVTCVQDELYLSALPFLFLSFMDDLCHAWHEQSLGTVHGVDATNFCIGSTTSTTLQLCPVSSLAQLKQLCLSGLFFAS
ncbi:MAG: hypothetical protein MHM6MM_005535 [Cercozoa sp. M6MM]